MSHKAGVSVKTRDRSRRVDRFSVSAIDRLRNIERGQAAMMRPQESVTHEAFVEGGSRDAARRVHGSRGENVVPSDLSAGDAARSIERSDGAIPVSHETVRNEVFVNVASTMPPDELMAWP